MENGEVRHRESHHSFMEEDIHWNQFTRHMDKSKNVTNAEEERALMKKQMYLKQAAKSIADSQRPRVKHGKCFI